MGEPTAAERLLPFALRVLSIAGLFIVVSGLVVLFQSASTRDYLIALEISIVFLVASPWSVKLPSGATWRVGLPLLMLGMFLLPPQLTALTAVPGLIFFNAKARTNWTKYPETVSHVALGVFLGGEVYHSLILALHPYFFGLELAIMASLTTHLLVNRAMSVLIVAHSRHRRLLDQCRRTLKEVHWGYLNSYLLIYLTALTQPHIAPFTLLLTLALLFGTFNAVAYYSKVLQLQKAALTDGLTGVENRTAWEMFADEPTQNSDQSLIVLDINDFKSINDELGHEAGDLVIQQVASSLNKHLPAKSRVFRYGGDEFIIYVPRHIEDARLELSQALCDLESEAQKVPITVSVGQASIPHDGSNRRELFHIADARMYHEKKQQVFHVSGSDIGVPMSLLGLILAVESRDRYTASHNMRVAHYAMKLGEHVGLERREIRSLFRAAVVHDIGKIGIPDEILNYPGHLSEAQRKIVEQHPQVGYDMCSKLGFSKEELEIVLFHHEKWDGTGYPRQLRATEIPLLVRIVTIADVYDAVTTQRPHRPAWSHERAMRFITDNAGVLFDPDLVGDWVSINFNDALHRDEPGWSHAFDEVSAALRSPARA